jgi:hypothetical protein
VSTGEITASEALVDLAFFALDHAVESVTSEGPLIPFALVEDEARDRRLERFMAGTLEEAQEEARQHVRAASAPRVAIAYDGYLTVDGERSDAVFVEAQESGDASGLILAQRYRPGGRLRKFSTVGNPAFVGESSLL